MRIVALAGVVAIGCASGVSHGEKDASAQALSAMVESLAADGGAGMQGAVFVDGELVFSGAIGRAELEWDAPMRPNVLLRVGSVSKPFGATVAAALASEGVVSLDAPIGDVIADLPDDKRAITLRQLALHTSGVRHYDFSNMLEANNFFVHQRLLDAALPLLADPLGHAPGEGVTYTSIGFNLLGAVCEEAAGESFGALLQSRVASPLGLANTVIDHPLEVIERRAGFYTVFPDGVLRNTIWRDSSDGYPSLGVLTTAEDLARFAHEVFAGETLVHLREGAMTPGALANGTPIERTLGWEIGRSEDGAIVWFGHNGETNGGMAVVRYYPASRTAVAGIANFNVFTGEEPTFYETFATEIPSIFGAGEATEEIQ